MYTIIYWEGEELYPLLNEDKTLRLFNTLAEADNDASQLEALNRTDIKQGRMIKKIECRVISIEGVKE